MNFGKIAFGALLVALGVLLLATRTGLAPPDAPMYLLRYWPILLIAFGLAFLASATKNHFLGCFASLLILGGTAFGLFWMSHHKKPVPLVRGVATIDLGRTKVESLSVRVRTLMGGFDIAAMPGRTRMLSVDVRNAAGDSTAGYRFDIAGKSAVFEWPQTTGGLGLSSPGTAVSLQVPDALPVALTWRGRFGSMHADLIRLRPTRCILDEIASTVRMELGDAGRPEEIRVRGFASTIQIRVPSDCPVQLVTKSAFTMTALSSDFMEHAPGRGKGRVHTAEGTGRLVKIFVDGPLIHVKIDRGPVTAVQRGRIPDGRG
jgi:cell wall-active antibiotic response 4TMS protein YvqF